MERSTLSPQLTTLISEFNSSTERIEHMARTYSDTDWQRTPSPDRWSAIECIWHLNWTSEEMIHNVREAFAKLPSKTHSGAYRLDIPGWFLVRALSPKNRIAKFKTTAPSSTQSTLNVLAVLERFRALQQEMIELIRGSHGKPLGAGRVVSPFHSKVKYNIYSAYRITAVHQHRHLDQAERAASA